MATLPGVKTSILDRFYNQARTDLPGGPLIVVVGKRTTAASSTAPDFVPYYLSSELDAITAFGENSQLHKAYYELTTSGASNIAVVALPANTVYDQTNGTLASSTYTGIDPFNEAFAAVEAARADIVVAWGRGSETTDWDDYATPVATPGGNTEYGFYADNSTVSSKSWAKRVADKCSEITTNSYPIIAVLGVKPIAGGENPAPSALADGVAFPNLISKETVDTGSQLSVVATEVRPLNTPSDWGWSNGACAYAAMISRLDADSAPTGKMINNIQRMRYNPTRTQALALVNMGVVGGQLDYQRYPRWVDATTFAKATSDFIRLTTVRITYDAVKLVRNVSQNYIGEGMSVAMRNAFETQISSALRAMQQQGAINHADFRVTYSPSQNRASVDLAIVPAFELREVIVSVSVNF